MRIPAVRALLAGAVAVLVLAGAPVPARAQCTTTIGVVMSLTGPAGQFGDPRLVFGQVRLPIRDPLPRRIDARLAIAGVAERAALAVGGPLVRFVFPVALIRAITTIGHIPLPCVPRRVLTPGIARAVVRHGRPHAAQRDQSTSSSDASGSAARRSADQYR